jgi:hypothetical protein
VITNQNVQRAKCGACNHVEYVEENQQLVTGFYINVLDYASLSGDNAGTYVCRETHLGKAARNIVANLRADDPDGERGNEHGNGNGDQGGSQNEPPADLEGYEAPVFDFGGDSTNLTASER